MKIAIPEFKGKIAPTFDFSRRLLLLDFFGGRLSGISPVDLSIVKGPDRAGFLKTHQVEVLLCGSVSRDLANEIEGCGIRVIPQLTGEITEVLKTLTANESVDKDSLTLAFKEKQGQTLIPAEDPQRGTQPEDLFWSRITGLGRSLLDRAKRTLSGLTFPRR